MNKSIILISLALICNMLTIIHCKHSYKNQRSFQKKQKLANQRKIEKRKIQKIDAKLLRKHTLPLNQSMQNQSMQNSLNLMRLEQSAFGS